MIKQNLEEILKSLPQNVTLVVATKGRSIQQIQEAISSGTKIIGENYVKEAMSKFNVIGNKVKWHLIGHLQTNKVRNAVKIFDMIETLDSVKLAFAIDKEAKKINKIMPVLIEVNSACEPQKSGVFPNEVEGLVEEIIKFSNLKLEGLMTMGPLVSDPEKVRPFFRLTKQLFDKLKTKYKNIDFRYLSMGMSATYKIAIQEGANIVRIGTAIFGVN
ncbi:MAG: YggS family pyridoxal phosphate-dependent enzyme [Candidatus Omnitrophica bacterium]|nr:YggS family pyridoxal phosphate-dependent enzyme [Candidatus Omnitrophota bacterium]